MNHLILWGLGEELKSIGGLTVGLSSLGGVEKSNLKTMTCFAYNYSTEYKLFSEKI